MLVIKKVMRTFETLADGPIHHRSNMICAVAGMTADANILINYARQAAQNYLLTYNEDIPCEQLVRRLCDLKQGYTQHGGNNSGKPTPHPALPHISQIHPLSSLSTDSQFLFEIRPASLRRFIHLCGLRLAARISTLPVQSFW